MPRRKVDTPAGGFLYPPPIPARLTDVHLPRACATAAVLLLLAPLSGQAQDTSHSDSLLPDSTTSTPPVPTPSATTRTFYTRFALGFVSSILAHESGHIIASYAVGGHPTFGFDRGRPTIYSGVDATLEPQKQFIFSAAGLTVQMLLDEAFLDIPHKRSGGFERGILTSGIATVLFYTTLGRNDRVSDVNFMAETSSLSKDQVSLIFGGIALLHVVRIHFKGRYAHFFSAPAPSGGMQVGLALDNR